MPDDIEFLKAETEAARNGQKAMEAQYKAMKVTADFYLNKSSELEGSLRTAIRIIGAIALVALILLGILIGVLYG